MSLLVHKHRWQPPSDIPVRHQGVYLLHGTGEHGGRYERLATRLAGLGWRVGAHDHPGHGLSGGQRGLIDPCGSLATQAAIQVQAFAMETGTPPILFGHSLGGVLAAELVLIHALPVSGLILSAPGFVPVMKPSARIKLALLSTLAPQLCLDLGYDPGELTHDDTEKAAALQDPLIHGVKSATLVNWLVQSGQRCLSLATTLRVDTLVLIAGDDRIIDSSQTRKFTANAPAEFICAHEYKGYFHELLNETPEQRERVMIDIEHWLQRLSE